MTGSKTREDLNKEINLLRWHKVANESALRAALIRTKYVRQSDKRQKLIMEKKGRKQMKERLMTIRDEEQLKPLEVGKEFVDRYEKDQHVQKNRFKQKTSRRLESLQGTIQKIKDREISRSRRAQCKNMKKLSLENNTNKKRMAEQKQIGIIDEYYDERNGICENNRALENNIRLDLKETEKSGNEKGNNDNYSNINAVVTSLNKLASLEQRTRFLNDENSETSTSLIQSKNERDNHDSEERPRSKDRMSKLSFSKSRTISTPGNPSRKSYSIQQQGFFAKEVTQDTGASTKPRMKKTSSQFEEMPCNNRNESAEPTIDSKLKQINKSIETLLSTKDRLMLAVKS